MGNETSSVPEDDEEEDGETRLVIHSALTQEYKDARFSTIEDCYGSLVETFGSGMLTKFTLTDEEFDVVFCLAFSDPAEHFSQIWSDNDDDDDDDEANVFHVFCALFLLCEEELHGFDNKTAAIYKLFDFDGSGALNQVELECLLQACVAGLSRATGTPPRATETQIEAMAAAAVASSPDGEATLGVLKEWLGTRRDVLTYLSEFMEARMVVDYQRRVEDQFQTTTQQFIAAARGEPPEISTSEVTEIIRALPGSPPTNAEIAAFVALVDDSAGKNGRIGFDEFADAILPWISFSIVDDDATGTLSPDELKLLIWISGGENGPEPSSHVVQRATRAMDFDKDGDVVRLEWLKYNAGTDPATGTLKFSKAARDLFKQMDADESAIVNCRELERVFESQLQDLLTNLEDDAITQVSPTTRAEIESLIHDAAHEVADLIDANADGIISWDEFSVHVDIITSKQDKIRQFAKLVLSTHPRATKPKCSAIHRAKKKRASIRVLARLGRDLGKRRNTVNAAIDDLKKSDADDNRRRFTTAMAPIRA